jgi:hypothetical protein
MVHRNTAQITPFLCLLLAVPRLLPLAVLGGVDFIILTELYN